MPFVIFVVGLRRDFVRAFTLTDFILDYFGDGCTR